MPVFPPICEIRGRVQAPLRDQGPGKMADPSVRTLLSARARKTAPRAGALPILFRSSVSSIIHTSRHRVNTPYYRWHNSCILKQIVLKQLAKKLNAHWQEDVRNQEDKTTMKTVDLQTAPRKGAWRIPLGLGCALALTFTHLKAASVDINLGQANNYAVLAGSAVTGAGSSVVNGGIGLSAQDPQAASDLTTAYNTAAGLAPNQTLTGQDLGGLTLTPGVYFFASSAELTGTLELNGEGLADPVFVFQIGSTLTTATDSSVVTINDDGSSTPGISVFWQVGSSATLGTGTAFEGNLLALTSITADTDATVLDGRLLAQNGAVTLDDNTITAPPAEVQGTPVPDTGGTLQLFGSGLAALVAFGRRFSR